eukprot:7377083-Prymnesium_polylepis.1
MHLARRPPGGSALASALQPRRRYEPPRRHAAPHLQSGPDPGQQSNPAPYDSLFRKYQQQGIREWRQQYNTRVDEHFHALSTGSKPPRRSRPGAGSGPIAALADETASRHLRPIKQYVPSEATSGRPPVAGRRARPTGRAEPPTEPLMPMPHLPATERLLRGRAM